MTGHELSIWSLIQQADWVVKLVLLILLITSIISWSMIIKHVQQIKAARRNLTSFEKQFWSTHDLGQLSNKLESHQGLYGAAQMFQVGYREFRRLRQRQLRPKATIDGVQRVMGVSLMRQADILQQGHSILATIGSVSPYVGLFGTVWGIMGSFTALGAVQQATLSMVAPGISEALIATAMGLFVAIPAVVAYNRMNVQSERLIDEYDNFQEEFISLLHREVFANDASDDGGHG